jgi:predicted small lipoprotein YifL
MSSSLFSPRLALVAGVVLLTLSACGRRGAPEAPPAPDASVEGEGQAQAPAGTLPSPVGAPRRSSRQGYVVPNEPFILDPLL